MIRNGCLRIEMRKSLWTAALFLALSGCGAIYITPSVSEGDSDVGNVQVIALNNAAVNTANASPAYTPRKLPAEFRRRVNAAAPRLVGATGTVREGLLDPEQRPTRLELRTPPEFAPVSPYQIGIGDVVLLSTPNSVPSAELTGLLAAQESRQGYRVQDDGMISIPDVGRVSIEGLTLEEAEAELFQALVARQIDPSFTLEISEFNSKKVAIGGPVIQSAIIPVTLNPLTLIEAITAAGGIRSADRDYVTIRIYRDGQLYQIPLRDYVKSPALQKTRLADGDSVYIDTEYELARAQAYFAEQIELSNLRAQARQQALAELNAEIRLRAAIINEGKNIFQALEGYDAIDRDYVYLTGEVNQQTRFTLPYERQATLADALYNEGGFLTETANPSQIYILREKPGYDGVIAYHLDTRNAVNLFLATRMQMRPNDIVFVAEQPVTKWNRVLQQVLPTVSAGRRLGN